MDNDVGVIRKHIHAFRCIKLAELQTMKYQGVSLLVVVVAVEKLEPENRNENNEFFEILIRMKIVGINTFIMVLSIYQCLEP